ncbi:MAG TPA: phosphoglycolate phosphatase [Aestuariivirgaceae bacterium]|jgi:phosphoglycolate phosphatase
MFMRGVVFDLDGTLVDTAPDLTRATNFVLASRGRKPVSAEDVRAMVGLGARTLIRRGFAATGDPVLEEDVEELFSSFLAYYADHIAIDSRLFPGSREVLNRCRQEGFKLGICTNKPETLSRTLIENLGLRDYFDAIVGMDTIKVAKPDPRIYGETLRRLDMNNGRSVMIGDSETDVLTARAAGVPVIGVTFGYTAKPVKEFAPDYLADSYEELWPLIQRALDS